jgi:hypothetical protein
VTDYEELTWDEAMRRGHAALTSERPDDDINASEGRPNIESTTTCDDRSQGRPGAGVARAGPGARWPRRAVRPRRDVIGRAGGTFSNIAEPAGVVRSSGVGRSRPGPLDYRRSTVQVTVRVTPSTAWMREATSLPRSSSPGAWILAMMS